MMESVAKLEVNFLELSVVNADHCYSHRCCCGLLLYRRILNPGRQTATNDTLLATRWRHSLVTFVSSAWYASLGQSV